MNNSSYWISLDIHDTASQAVLAVKKGDNSRKICASLTENGKEYAISEGCTAVFTAKKPDGTKLYNDCVIVDNSITYVTTNNTTSAVGLVECEFRLISPEDKLLVCPRFTLIVEDTVVDDDDVMDSSDEFSALSKMVGKVERADEMAQEALDAAEEAVERAESTRGLYVGSGNMPEGYDIQIDPTGEALLLDDEMSDTSENVPKTKVVKEYVDAIAIESTEHPGCYYRMVDGEVEWLNPPMVETWGIYRTTKRHNGKTVYMTKFSIALPNNTTSYLGYEMSGTSIVGYQAVTDNGISVPTKYGEYVASDGQVHMREIDLQVAPWGCSAITNFDASYMTAYVTVEYVYN